MSYDTASPYSDADIRRFCEMSRIAPEMHDNLATALSDAARVWEDAKELPSSKVSATDRSKELRQFLKKADAFLSSFDSLSDAAWEAMQYASDVFNFDPSASRIDTVAGHENVGDFGHERNIHVAPHSDEPYSISDTNLRETVETLATLAGIGRELLPDLRRGPSRDFPLESWMRRMVTVSNSIGVPFRRDVAPDGSPISPAACLCVEAYRVLAPQTPHSRVLNAMKNEIKTQREALEKLKASRS